MFSIDGKHWNFVARFLSLGLNLVDFEGNSHQKWNLGLKTFNLNVTFLDALNLEIHICGKFQARLIEKMNDNKDNKNYSQCDRTDKCLN